MGTFIRDTYLRAARDDAERHQRGMIVANFLGLRSGDMSDGRSEVVPEQPQRVFHLVDMRPMLEIEQSMHDRVGHAQFSRQGDFRHATRHHCIVERHLRRDERRQRDRGLAAAGARRDRDRLTISDVAPKREEQDRLGFL